MGTMVPMYAYMLFVLDVFILAYATGNMFVEVDSPKLSDHGVPELISDIYELVESKIVLTAHAWWDDIVYVIVGPTAWTFGGYGISVDCTRYINLPETLLGKSCTLPVTLIVFWLVAFSVLVWIHLYLFCKCVRLLQEMGITWYVSLCTSLACAPPLHSPNTLRLMFRETPRLDLKKPLMNHTHPVSASARTGASKWMDYFASRLGLVPYYIQMTSSDIRASREGSRSYFWEKDLSVGPSITSVKGSHILCLSDVDMYMDMNAFLTEHWNPVLISTVQPDQAAKGSGEYSYLFLSDNQLEYRVSGGAVYKHHIWNYGSDFLTVIEGVKLYRPWQVVSVYHVDRISMSPDHYAILLTPMRRFVTIFGFIPIKHEPLRRFEPVMCLEDAEKVQHKFVKIRYCKAAGQSISLAKLGSYSCATVAASIDDAIAAQARISRVALTTAQTETISGITDKTSILVLTEYHRLENNLIGDYMFPVEESVWRYQFKPARFDPDAKPMLKPFMNPIVPLCFAPDVCKNNEEASIEGRIQELVANRVEVKMTPRLMRSMEAFFRMLVPERNKQTYVPEDDDVVFAKQNRPTQRRILEQAADDPSHLSREPIKSFMKKEAYGKVTDPRVISQIPPKNKLKYSKYIYVVASILRRAPWYSFGKTPLQIATRVAMICSKAKRNIVKTDMFRMDGNVSPLAREIEHAFLLWVFSPNYHQELNEVHATQHNQYGFGMFGTKYETDSTRLSGSTETADMNSFLNAFMAFDDIYNSPYEGVDLTPEEAYALLGEYGGDDGITPDRDVAHYTATCASIGQVLEAEEVKKGDVGVDYLARLYGPEVWHGDPTSMCDVKRQLSKLHVTVSLPASVTPIQKLAEKLVGFSLSDHSTPIIGDLYARMCTVCPEVFPGQLGTLGSWIAPYAAHFDDIDEQYPNDYDSWMDDEVSRTLPTFDTDKFNRWLGKCKEADDFLRPPQCVDDPPAPVVKKPVVVAGEIKVPVAEGSVVTPPKAEKPVVKDVLKKCKFTKAECKFGVACKYIHVAILLALLGYVSGAIHDSPSSNCVVVSQFLANSDSCLLFPPPCSIIDWQMSKAHPKPVQKQKQKEKPKPQHVKHPQGASMIVSATSGKGSGPKDNSALLHHRALNVTNRRQQIIEEDEYICEVMSNTSYAPALGTWSTTGGLYLNPANANMFIWASTLAAKYEKYDVDYVEFYFKSETTELQPNGIGKVMFGFDYDANDGGPTTKQAIELMDPHSDCKPCQDMSMRLDRREILNGLGRYCLAGNVPTGTDVKTYHSGILWVFSQGQTTAGASIGELHVKYRFRLRKPTQTPSTSITVNSAQASWLWSNIATPGSSQITNSFTGVNDPHITVSGTTVGPDIVANINFLAGAPPGRYLIDILEMAASGLPINPSQPLIFTIGGSGISQSSADDDLASAGSGPSISVDQVVTNYNGGAVLAYNTGSGQASDGVTSLAPYKLLIDVGTTLVGAYVSIKGAHSSTPTFTSWMNVLVALLTTSYGLRAGCVPSSKAQAVKLSPTYHDDWVEDDSPVPKDATCLVRSAPRQHLREDYATSGRGDKSSSSGISATKGVLA